MAEEKTNTTTEKAAEKTAPAVKLNKRIGNTTYRVTMHFKENGKEDMNDKIKRLIRMECV